MDGQRIPSVPTALIRAPDPLGLLAPSALLEGRAQRFSPFPHVRPYGLGHLGSRLPTGVIGNFKASTKGRNVDDGYIASVSLLILQSYHVSRKRKANLYLPQLPRDLRRHQNIARSRSSCGADEFDEYEIFLRFPF
jgi:hypothetical protein